MTCYNSSQYPFISSTGANENGRKANLFASK